MSGECKSYRLNEPMAWKEFKTMPDDIKVTYINLLRGKYGVPDGKIADMMGIHMVNFSKEMSQIRSRIGDSFKKRTGEFDKDGFYAWVNGVDKLPTPVPEEITVEEPIQAEPEAYVEDDLPFDIVPVEEPDCAFTFVPMAQCQELEAENALMKAQIDGLQKANDALMAANEKDKQKIEWLENRVNDLELERHILEKQMEVVRMIFGGRGNGN